ncbi:MAG: helix-turn-helix transcriptional regulator [Cryomorphaceae bacterium]
MKNNLRQYRADKKLTQQDLAEAIGVSRQSIIAIESGKYVPSTLLSLKLAEKLAVSVEALFELERGD